MHTAKMSSSAMASARCSVDVLRLIVFCRSLWEYQRHRSAHDEG